MGAVVVLTLVFILVSLVGKKLSEYFEFLFKSNLKYRFLDYIGKFI
jgi:hypothetical protein